jgi:8-oxo-dGTP pyrophosphatase MutT (NUDIX family)
MKDVNVKDTLVSYSSAGGVVIHDDRMLLLNRPGRGEIRLPKGHIEPGETAEATALRETAEEAGYAELTIVADLGEHVVRFEYEGKTFMRNEHYFLMRLDGDGRHPQSAKDAAQFVVIWVALDEAVERLTYAAEQAVARRAVEVHRAGGG